MAGLFDTFTIAKRGINVQQTNINTSAHNIANANTHGYTRQRAVVQTTRPQGGNSRFDVSAAGQMGTGAQIKTIQRIRNEFVDRQVRDATGDLGYSNMKADFLSKVEDILGETSDTGIQGLTTELYKSLQSLTTAPEKTDIKNVVLQNALALTDSINYTYTQLEKQLENAQDLLSNNVAEINNCLDQLNELNKQITRITALGQSPNDLMDSRDLLLDQLSSKFGINVDKASLNGINLTSKEYGDMKLVNAAPNEPYDRFSTVKDAVLKGDTLEVTYYPLGDKNGKAETITITADPNDPASMEKLKNMKDELTSCRIIMTNSEGKFTDADGNAVTTMSVDDMNKKIFNTYQNKNGVNSVATDPAKLKGEIAGIQAVQNSIKGYMKDLDKFAAGMAYAMNAIQTGSMDGTNALPGSELIFVVRDSNPPTDDGISAKNFTINKALLDDPSKLNSKPDESSGNGANDRAIAMAALNTLKFNFAAVGDDPAGWNRADFLKNAGVSFTDGDPNNPSKNINLSGDSTGSTMIVQYTGIISKLGAETKTAIQSTESKVNILQGLENQKLSESGVSMDEEMTDLIAFQHAYKANAKMVSTIDELLDVVINGLKR